jgi:putative peptide zinc metalloprotease protein
VSDPRPRLCPGVTLIEQVYRGERSYVAKDPATRKYFRFRPAEAAVVRCLDGTRTPAEVAAALAEAGLRVSAAAVAGFAKQLAKLGIVERTLAERTTLQVERMRAERTRRRRPALFRGELLRMRWSMGSPDRLLERTMPALRWCFTRGFVIASAALFAAYFVILALTWGDFSRTLGALFSPDSISARAIALFWILSIVITVIHEFGHAYACKNFGGEVHEMGFMLLFFQPAFYCNVNDAWSFPDLRARLWVTAAGSWIQFVVAALAAFVWWAVVPGSLLSEVAVVTMLVGGITNVISNANPLIPLDGYFALSDYLEVPNLRHRAFGHVKWWIMRHVLRLELPEPPATEREQRVFLIYGSLAVGYVALIFLVVASLLFGWARQALGAAGGAIVLAGLFALVRRPVREWWRAAVLAVRARRASRPPRPTLRRAGAVAVAALLLAAVVPAPLTTGGPFTAVPVLTQALTAPDSGVVAQVTVREGMRVEAGSPVVRLSDFGAERERVAWERAADSLAAREAQAVARGATGVAERLAAEQAAAGARLAALRERLAALTVRARARGEVTTARPEELLGRRLRSGDTILTLSDVDSLELRIALDGAGAALARAGQPVRLVSHADVAHPTRATVASIAPAGGRAGGLEARVRLPAGGGWRPGVQGEASVEFARSSVLHAMWWAVRRRIRSDLLLAIS